MTDNVIPLKKQQLVWVCQCGCSTFSLLDDGSAECSFCATNPSVGGGWHENLGDAMWQGADPFSNVEGNGSIEFAKRVVAKRAAAKDVCAIVVIRANGATHVWSDVDSDEKHQWLSDMFDAAKQMARPKP